VRSAGRPRCFSATMRIGIDHGDRDRGDRDHGCARRMVGYAGSHSAYRQRSYQGWCTPDCFPPIPGRIRTAPRSGMFTGGLPLILQARGVVRAVEWYHRAAGARKFTKIPSGNYNLKG
jgi:hypothetical protein